MKRPVSHDRGTQPTELRIIGGTFRGRKLVYSGDTRTRPMKDRVREAVFNLLREKVKGTFAIDLFAGTGALGLEAMSRGSVGAIFIERHFPTLKLIRQNAATLEIDDRCQFVPGSTFVWSRKFSLPTANPWLVFVSPPYAFFHDQQAEMLRLIQTLADAAPSGSWFVVESDEPFDVALLPAIGEWDTREYPPAVISICQKPADEPR